MKKTLVNYYLFFTLLFTFIIIFLVSALYVKTQNDVFVQTSKELKSKILQNYKAELKNRVETVEQVINHKKETSTIRLKQSIQTRVLEALKIAESLYAGNKAKMSEEALKDLIVETLRHMRFNHGRGYYFIDTLEGDCVLFPVRPSDEGKNIAHYQDVNGKYVIKDFIEIAKSTQEGFSEYITLKPPAQIKKGRKIVFVKLFEKFNWIIGAGEYIDDVEEDIKRELAEEIAGYRINNEEGYFNLFEIYNFEGGENFARMIVNPSLQNTTDDAKISDDVHDIDGVYYRKEALAQLRGRGEGFITYKYKKLLSSEIIPKISYVKRIKHWNWVIETGKNLDTLDSTIKENEMVIMEQITRNIRYAIALFLGVLFFLVILVFFISKKIKQDMGMLSRIFRLASRDKMEIDEKLFGIEEFKELSSYANTMIREIKFHQENLEHINENLEFKVFEKTKELQQLNFSLEIKNKELEENYLCDTLTKLPNRNMFTKEFTFTAFPQVFLIDIDGFKHINDFYGTEVGDSILVEFAAFIKSFAHDNEMKAYRLSSDEFLLLFDKRFNQSVAEAVIKQINILLTQKRFNVPEESLEFQMNVTCSVAYGKNTILEKADVALNYAKSKKLSFAIYDDENLHMNHYKQNIHWRQKVLDAIANDTIVPYFQKIVDINDASIEKYECLMRLVDKDEAFSPYLFLEVAKETRLYHQLTRIMIAKSFDTFANTEASFSLNISLLDIENTKTVEFLEESIERHNMGSRLILELLESEDIMSSSQFLVFVQKMKALGVRFALDDFGTGYSNFAFVLKIAPAYLKIDGSLIKNIIEDKNAYNVVQAIVAFAQEINAEVIAEYVENEQQVEALRACDVHLLQGYYFSIPSASFENRLNP